MKIRTVLSVLVACSALSSYAVVVRKLPAITVVENETQSVDSMKATSVRSSNAAVFSAALREEGEAVVNGIRLGEANLVHVDGRGVFATRPVKVVPAYWDVLRRMFYDDPEITVDIVGDKVVVGGATANVDTLKRVDQARALDPARIVVQVSYSTAQIGELVRDFLSRAAISNIAVNVVGREVCLSGRMYDQKSIAQLKSRVESFVKDYPGVTVNADDLRIYKQKILISIEFVQYNDTLARNLGFKGPETLTATLNSSNIGYTRDTKHGNSESHEWTRDFTVDFNAEATVNMLKKNGAAKTSYATTLSTQSGIEVEFQNGGTYYERTDAGLTSSGGISEIEYGYIIKATPFILDDSTINLDLSLDNKQPTTEDGRVDRVSRYQTKSKYLMRPGESIALSGFTAKSESEIKHGTPFLSKIPLIGSWLFGSTDRGNDMKEMMLVVTVNWSLEDMEDKALDRLEEIKSRPVDVEMP